MAAAIEERRKAIDDIINQFEGGDKCPFGSKTIGNLQYIVSILVKISDVYFASSTDEGRRAVAEDALYFESRLAENSERFGFNRNIIDMIRTNRFIMSPLDYRRFMEDRKQYLPNQ